MYSRLGFQLENDIKSKMINNTCDQESDINAQNPSVPKSISRQYPGFKNPRIVTASREYGGKDRHSKVWTIKGLKDRRIRLSVPTAVQLYHLQEQLGLSQPSKVIDWLLDVTKEDINKLPPLQMTLEDFNRFHHPDYDYSRTKGKEVAEEYKLNSYSYNDIQSSSNLCLSRFGHHLDTYAYEPQFLSCVSGNATASLYPQYFMHSHLQLLGSSPTQVQVPLSLIDTQAKVLFGFNMNSKVSSESNDNGGIG